MWASYQLNQKPCARSSLSTAETVRASLRCMLPLSMTPSPAAATVVHSPQAILVGDVLTDGTGSAAVTSILSAARPRSVVIASIER